MPKPRLQVIHGGDHGLASSQAEIVAALILRHLR
jgi:hypothetical protein